MLNCIGNCIGLCCVGVFYPSPLLPPSLPYPTLLYTTLPSPNPTLPYHTLPFFSLPYLILLCMPCDFVIRSNWRLEKHLLRRAEMSLRHGFQHQDEGLSSELCVGRACEGRCFLMRGDVLRMKSPWRQQSQLSSTQPTTWSHPDHMDITRGAWFNTADWLLPFISSLLQLQNFSDKLSLIPLVSLSFFKLIWF